jgi:hypothetical protein
LQKYYYIDGTPKAEIEYKQGILNGPIRLYDSFGRLCRELAFVEGKRDGVEHIWNKEGMLIIEAFFRQDIPTGKARQWYDNGNPAIEIDYDDKGIPISTRKWKSSGAVVDDTGEHDDYFDQVTKQTGVLTDSLTTVVDQLAIVLPILAQTIDSKNAAEQMPELEEQMAKIKNEMENLKKINQELIQEAGLDPAHPKEPFWKTPSMRQELEQQVEVQAGSVSLELARIQKSLANALEGILKNAQKDENEPKS